MSHTSVLAPVEPQKIVCYPRLAPLLPEHHQLWLNVECSILTLINTENATPLYQQLLSPGEMYAVETILQNYPDYCPYEVVLSAMTGKSIEKCRERVLWGIDNKAIDVVMRPARNLMGRIRMKVHPFGIDIKSLINMGYLVVPLDTKRQRPRD